MVDVLNKDELLGKVLGTKLPVSPVAEAVSLKAPEQVAAPVDFSAAKADKPLPVKEDYMAAVKPDIEALGQAEEEKLKFAGLEKIDTAKREAAKQTALGESAAKQRQDILDDPSRAEYKRALEDKAKPFIPHEENAQDLMMLFGLLNIVGFAIGAGGKQYSQAAMSAMNGMLEGHQKGRDDLYKKEKSIFETNQKQLDSRIKQLLAFMQDSELLTNMDKTARDQAIQGKFLEDGATFLTEYYKKNGYGKTVETLKEMVKASGKAAELVSKEQTRAADQDFTLRLDAQKARETREQKRNEVLAQYDLASQKLTEEAKRAKANNDFRLEEEISRRAFAIETAKANWTHGENLAEINRKAAADIELARIDRDKIRDQNTAEFRLKEKEYQDKRLQFEREREKETSRHNKVEEELRAKEIESKKLKGQGGLGAKAFLESTLGVTAPDEKTSQKIVDTALGVSQLGHVITLFKDPEVKAGVMSKLSSIKEKLASLGDNNYEISESELRQIIDGEISPSAKNAVAQKEALFAAYTAEREIAGGRLLVSVVKQAGGALDPTNYEKAGYLNLLGSRREELVKRLRGALMNDEQINTVVQSIEGKAKNDRSFGKAADKKDYSRPANMSDADWAEYKKAHGG